MLRAENRTKQQIKPNRIETVVRVYENRNQTETAVFQTTALKPNRNAKYWNRTPLIITLAPSPMPSQIPHTLFGMILLSVDAI